MTKLPDSKLHITSGKILKDATIVECEWTEDRLDAKPAEQSGVFKDLPKQTLIDAMAALEVHAACLIEDIGVPDKWDNISALALKRIATIHVSGFSLSNSKQKGQGIIITAQKTLSTGKVFGFNTPLVHFDDSSESSYKHTSQLWRDVEKVKEELVKYIGGDHAPDPQQSLFSEDEKVTKLKVAEEETIEEKSERVLGKPKKAAKKAPGKTKAK